VNEKLRKWRVMQSGSRPAGSMNGKVRGGPMYI